MGTMIYVNRTDSYCGNCGKPASMREPGHISVLGYRPGPGCGEEWIGVSSHYPDLPKLFVEHGMTWTDTLDGLPVYEFGRLIGYVGGGNGVVQK